ncbi:hypothetical protein BV898_14164 [Hypsibius exemplaris]|uniref:G-protein coupled receptors family 1 profile domain-containing protein n=1 Tax=Hypsibius exemplaris TaxID=2072580 RepID=A0A1W0W8L9_HYPEX|nr:hypothetical protein BV898_14164 [Hypsibius exemplaris]
MQANNMASESTAIPATVETNMTNAFGTSPSRSAIYESSKQRFFVVGVLTIPVSIVGALGSIITLNLIIRQNSQHRSSASSLMVSLCVDTVLLCGITSFFDAFTMLTGGTGAAGDYGPICIMFAFLHFWWLSVSAHSHAAVAIHRLIAVLKIDQKHVSHRLSSKLLASILIAYTWLVPLLVLVFPIFDLGGTYGFNGTASRCSIVSVSVPYYGTVLMLMNSFVPLGIMVICYSAIFVKILRTRRKFNLDESAIRSQGAARGVRLLRFKAEIRVTYIAFLTCIWFCVFYMPSSVHSLAVSNSNDPMALQSALAQAFVLMTWIGCATTPILYTLLSTDMRTAIKKEWLRVLRRRSNTVSAHVHIIGSRDHGDSPSLPGDAEKCPPTGTPTRTSLGGKLP